MKWPRVLVSLGLEVFQNTLVTHGKIKYKGGGKDLGKGKKGRREREMEGGEERKGERMRRGREWGRWREERMERGGGGREQEREKCEYPGDISAWPHL